MKRIVGFVSLSFLPAAVFAGLSSQSYVQSGLVLQLDGIDNAGTGTHSASATTWKDLKGSSDFEVNTSAAAFTDGNRLKKTGSDYMAKYATARTDVRTIETAVTDIPSSGWVIAMMISRNQCVTFSDGGGDARLYCFDDKKYGMKGLAKTSPVTVSAVFSSQTAASGFFVNGVQPTGNSYTDYWTASPNGEMSIGGRVNLGYGSELPVKFSVCGVRLYNRKLTAAEAWHNWAVDSIRFHNTTPANSQVSGDDLQWRVAASASGNGTVAMDGGAAGASATSAWVTSTGSATKTVTLVAAPKPGAGFGGWTGDTSAIVSGSIGSREITVAADHACALTATFVTADEGWVGAGTDTKITTAANWATATDLTGGTALMKVMGGTTATVPADGTTYSFKGVSAQTSGFVFDAESGAKAVTLGAQGLTNTAGSVTWGWPTTLGPAASKTISSKSTTAQIWHNGTDKTLAIRGPLSGADIYFQGRGRVDVYSTNEIETAFVGGSNSDETGAVQVYQRPGARLVKEGGTVNCSCKVTDSASTWGFHLMGGTHKYNILAGTHNNGNPSAFFVEAGTTNVLTGSFTTQWSNESTMGIKGYLCVQGGLTATSSSNAQGCWRPFARHDNSYKTGYLKVETKPMTANRVCIPWGTLELAAVGNTFATRGLFVEGGLVKTTVANALETGKKNKLKLTSGTFDLCGFDQGVDLFCGNGGTVTSAKGAQLHVVNSDYFFDSNFNKEGAPASSPALNLGTNMTVCTTLFTGGAGLAKEGTKDLYIAAANTSTGVLSVANGRLVLSAANSAAKYPGTSFNKTQGSWAGRIEVTGGTLVIEHSSALGPKATLYVSGGQVELAEGLMLPVYQLYVADGKGGWTSYRGMCGGAASGAANQPVFPGTTTPVFTGKGSICVGATLPGGWPTTAKAASWTAAGSDTLVTTAENWNPVTANPYDGSLFANFAAGYEAKLPNNDFAFVQGMNVTQSGFGFSSGVGSSAFLGEAGLTNTATGVTWDWPASIGSFEPLWWLAKDSKMELRAPLTGTGNLKIWGGGRLDVYSTNTLQGTVYVGDENDQSANPKGEVYVYLHPGAQLAGAGGTMSIGCRCGWGLHLMGNTLDCNVIAGTQNNPSPAALYVEPGTTNVINGSFTTQYGNNSFMGVAGHLTIRGGAKFQHDRGMAMQRFRPVNAGTGTLRIESKSVESRLCEVAYGRFELAAAGNVFHHQGLWLNGGRVVIDADNALVAQGKTSGNDNNCAALTSGTFDLNGHDVQLDAVNARGGKVTSASPAQFCLKDNVLHAYTGEISKYLPSYGKTGTVCKTVFEGMAGFKKEGSLDFYLAAVSSSTGTLTVAKGKLVMSAYSKSATYPGTAFVKSYGAWTAGRAEVTGGTLVLEHNNALSKDVVLAVTEGVVQIESGVRARVGELWVNGVKLEDGIYGGADSAAPNKLDVLTGTGIIRVGHVGLRLIIAGSGSSPAPISSTPRLTFGVLSDIHITSRGKATDTYRYGSAQTFVHALEYFRDNGADAVVIAGDMADRGLPENLQVVADAWSEVFPNDAAPDGRHVERIFIYGNHDADKSWFVNSSGLIKDTMTQAEKDALIARSISRNESNVWENVWGDTWSPAYTKVIKGYRFIAAHWGHEAEAVDLIEQNCFDLKGSKPFFYIQHPHLKNTVYGSSAWGADSGVTATALSTYPNAIALSGHSHYPIALEASAWQGEFTSIGCGSLSYVSHWGPTTVNTVSTETRPGMLFTVYDDRIEVKRREFVADKDVGPDWQLAIPASGSGFPYAYTAQQTRLAAPEFPSGAKVVAEPVAEGLQLTVPAAVYDTSHARVLMYELAVKQSGATVYTANIRQEGYFRPIGTVPSSTVWTIPAESLPSEGSLTLELKAVDFYGRKSAALATVVDR